MIARLGRNPYAIALLSIAIVGAIATAWSLALLLDEQGFGFSEEQLSRARLSLFVQGIPVPATMTTVAALLGVLVIGSATSARDQGSRDEGRGSDPPHRPTRTTTEAGSTRTRAATTVPNSSPSISTSSEPPSISMPPERPRE